MKLSTVLELCISLTPFPRNGEKTARVKVREEFRVGEAAVINVGMTKTHMLVSRAVFRWIRDPHTWIGGIECSSTVRVCHRVRNGAGPRRRPRRERRGLPVPVSEPP